MAYDLTSLFQGLGGGNYGGLLKALFGGSSGFGGGGSLFGGGSSLGSPSPGMQPPGTQNALSSAYFRAFPGAPLGPYAIPSSQGAPTMNQLTAAPTNLPQAGAVQPPLQEGATPSLNQGGYGQGGVQGTTYGPSAIGMSAPQILSWLLGQSGGVGDSETAQVLQRAALYRQMLLGG